MYYCCSLCIYYFIECQLVLTIHVKIMGHLVVVNLMLLMLVFFVFLVLYNVEELLRKLTICIHCCMKLLCSSCWWICVITCCSFGSTICSLVVVSIGGCIICPVVGLCSIVVCVTVSRSVCICSISSVTWCCDCWTSISVFSSLFVFSLVINMFRCYVCLWILGMVCVLFLF